MKTPTPIRGKVPELTHWVTAVLAVFMLGCIALLPQRAEQRR
jgi:hypothetical protein